LDALRDLEDLLADLGCIFNVPGASLAVFLPVKRTGLWELDGRTLTPHNAGSIYYP
jgi:hypothetical protein